MTNSVENRTPAYEREFVEVCFGDVYEKNNCGEFDVVIITPNHAKDMCIVWFVSGIGTDQEMVYPCGSSEMAITLGRLIDSWDIERIWSGVERNIDSGRDVLGLKVLDEIDRLKNLQKLRQVLEDRSKLPRTLLINHKVRKAKQAEQSLG